jgi:hypothetical protein
MNWVFFKFSKFSVFCFFVKTKQLAMKETEKKSLDPPLWQACAGSMVQIPPLNRI